MDQIYQCHYVHHKLKDLNVGEYWKGKFPKNLSPTYEDCSILKDAKYMIDMSIIKGDGAMKDLIDYIAKALVDNPKLMERPIVTTNKQAIIGRPPENVLNLFS